MFLNFSHEIQDGKLSPDVGRIVMLEGLGMKSIGPSRDHNDLLRAFASKYHLYKDDVISHAHRFYYRLDGDTLTVCPVMRVDEYWYDSNQEEFKEILRDLFLKRN